jgi:type IV secretory pathway VirD2 relaxase
MLYREKKDGDNPDYSIWYEDIEWVSMNSFTTYPSKMRVLIDLDDDNKVIVNFEDLDDYLEENNVVII